MNFNCLRSLNLLENRIPQKSFKNIIKNLPNLQILTLRAVGIRLEENGPASTKFEFPKYLTKLTMSDCYQFNCDSNDPVNMEMGGVRSIDRNSFNLDISNIIINTVRNLTWNSYYRGSVNSLNQLLANNVELETLDAPLDKLNSTSLSLISHNRNLTKLIISSLSDMTLSNIIFPKLPFIKSIKIATVFYTGIESVSCLLKNCPSLEELKYRMSTRRGNISHTNIQDSKNLKKLSIYHSNLDLLLSVPFPDSTLEHLEFISSAPFKVGFGIFNNLSHLKIITIKWLPPEFMEYDYNDQLCDSNYKWREIKYSKSVQFWKIF